MAEYKAAVSWRRRGEGFLEQRYSREHTWTFDGGVVVPASPAPTSVRPPFSNPECVDPEEALVAALSSCHMLGFLHLASKRGFLVDAYDDEASGVMTANERGVLWVSRATLRPRAAYGEGRGPSPDEERRLHHQAHEECYIANSVRTEVVVEL
ncbi:MAG TPA: OsmC family protein [Opitutaceae bacterium]|jgi:organic hydroperoxide reductase OsmC/OhrA